jgi:hypothetical protein
VILSTVVVVPLPSAAVADEATVDNPPMHASTSASTQDLPRELVIVRSLARERLDCPNHDSNGSCQNEPRSRRSEAPLGVRLSVRTRLEDEEAGI